MNYTNLTASAAIGSGSVYIDRIIVNSTSSGTFKLTEGNGGTTIVNTITPTAPSVFELKIDTKRSCYITIANTLDITVVWS